MVILLSPPFGYFADRLLSMETILVLGAGRSSSALITYLLQQAAVHSWKIIVGDVSDGAAWKRIGGSTRGRAIVFDIHD